MQCFITCKEKNITEVPSYLEHLHQDRTKQIQVLHYSKYQKSKEKHLLPEHSHTQHQHYETNYQNTSEISHR